MAIGVGERTCAFDGCNSLEFRTTGFCLKHKGDVKPKSEKNQIKFVKNNSEINYGPIYVLIGGPLLFIGYRLQSERVTHWFEGLINGMFQFCGFLLIATGMFFLSYGIFLLKSKSKVEY